MFRVHWNNIWKSWLLNLIKDILWVLQVFNQQREMKFLVWLKFLSPSPKSNLEHATISSLNLKCKARYLDGLLAIFLQCPYVWQSWWAWSFPGYPQSLLKIKNLSRSHEAKSKLPRYPISVELLQSKY